MTKLSELTQHLNARALVGLAIVLAFLVLGYGVGAFAPAHALEWRSAPPNLGPTLAHLLGTTSLGQDTFWLLAASLGSSLSLSLSVAAASTLIGVSVGMLAGFRGGLTDRAISLVTDTLIVIPLLPLLLLLAAMTQGKVSQLLLGLVLVAFNWPYPARQIRAVTLSLREREFIHVAALSGESLPRILTFQVAPYLSSWSLANLANTVLVVLTLESSLAVTGLASPNTPTLGTMIFYALEYQAVLAHRWWWIGAPVASIILLFVGLFLASSGLAQASAERRGRVSS